MSIESNLSEIRQALATLSAIHAAGGLTRADVNACVAFVEARCAEIEGGAAPAEVATLRVLTLAEIAAQARAESGRAAGRRHLRAVPSEGDAA